MEKNWSGERLETFILSRDSIEHLHRYSIVNQYIKDKTVLDIACGEGYGSFLMSNLANKVYGVDIDNDTIVAANLKYKKNNLSFRHGSTSAIPLDDNSIDVIVSFETLEHHDEHEIMMHEIKRVLKKDGLVVISTPDKLHYTDIPKFTNKFHVKELYKDEFISLVSNYFSNVQLLIQQYLDGVSILQDETKIDNVDFYSGDYSKIDEIKISPLFLVAIASNVNFITQKTSLFGGTQIIEAKAKNDIYASNSYKVGSFILYPLKLLKKILKR